MKRTSRIFGLVLMVLLIIGISDPVSAEEIHISTVEDLHELAQNASIDQWSRGKIIILDNDIDLNEEAFRPIAIFAGSFDGNGHTISGLLIDEEGSNFGLFRYLEAGGEIKNLNLEGRIIPSGEKNFIGGLVGNNQGRIENSSFTGLVEGNEKVGGLVGFNGESGIIISSSAAGNIEGQKQVGGIAGHNQGSIIESSNRADINTRQSINPGLDLGGIAGLNKGLIDDCENFGDLGYTSQGVNIGGIVGRENGHIGNSRNYGNIYGQSQVGGIAGKMEPQANLIIPDSKLEKLKEELDLLDSAIGEMVRKTRTNSNSIEPNLWHIQRDINRSKSQIQSLLRNSDEEDYQGVLQALEGIIPIMDNMSYEISDLMNNISSQGKDLADNMESSNDQISNLSDLMLEIIEELSAGDLEIQDIAVDLSRQEANAHILATISNCQNFGSVQADSKAGGIVGSLEYDFILDLENEFGIEEELTINTVLELRAIILDSENTGNISCLYDNVGGIIGNMELGYLTGSISSGTIESRYGDYVGGIAGNALGIIESSYSKNQLMGRNYIGGIAGRAKEIGDSYSLIKIDQYAAFIGAIAGDIYPDSIIEGNYFVSQDLHGIDSVSYVGLAEPIEYEDLLSRGNTPDIFEKFQLDFRREGKLVKTINFQYGDSISIDEFPDIPPKQGYYGRWEDFDPSNLTFDMEINAQYLPYISIIEAEEERNSLPVLMVEGLFSHEDLLDASRIENPQDDGQEPIEEWQISIPTNMEKTNRIRYLPPDGSRNLQVYILDDGYWVKTDSQRDGDYLVFETSASNITFRVVQEPSLAVYLTLSFTLVLAIALIANKYLSR